MDQQEKRTYAYTAQERLDMITPALIRFEKVIEQLKADVVRLNAEVKKLENTQFDPISSNNQIIATIKNVYQLEDYPYKDKILTVYMLEFDEFVDKLYLHRIQGNVDGLYSGAKATFKLDGDKIRDFKQIRSIISHE